MLYNLVLFVLLLTAASIFIGELSGGQERKVIVDLGLSAMLLFGVFIAIFVGVGLVYKEIERRTIYAVFSKPVGRGEFLVGKYLGLCLTLLVNVAGDGSGSFARAVVRQSRLGSADSYNLARGVIDLPGVDAVDGRRPALLLVFLAGALGSVNVSDLYHWSLQCRPKDSRRLSGQHQRALVLYWSVLPAAESC